MEFHIHPILNQEKEKKFLVTEKGSGRQAYIAVANGWDVYHEESPLMPEEEQMTPEELQAAFLAVKNHICEEKHSLDRKLFEAKKTATKGVCVKSKDIGGRD